MFEERETERKQKKPQSMNIPVVYFLNTVLYLKANVLMGKNFILIKCFNWNCSRYKLVTNFSSFIS